MYPLGTSLREIVQLCFKNLTKLFHPRSYLGKLEHFLKKNETIEIVNMQIITLGILTFFYHI